jgi:hypothetical protein
MLSELYAERPIRVDNLLQAMLESTKESRFEDLDTIRDIAYHERDYGGIVLGIMAVRILPAWGVPGIQILSGIAQSGWWSDEALAVLLDMTSADLDVNTPAGKLSLHLPNGTLHAAKSALQDIAANAGSNVEVFRHLYMSLFMAESRNKQVFDGVLSIITSSRLVVNEALLKEFHALLEADPREEEVHQFIVQHPTLIDPLAQQIWTKHDLGDDFITDFVLQRVNNEYVLVEIERPGHKIFTQGGILTSATNTALAQVRDFQRWVAVNIAYAQRKLPGIVRPEGLVVIGRRGTLTDDDAERLSEENFTRRGQARIVTFDFLIEQARAVRENLLRSPQAIRSSQQPRLSPL